MNTKQTGALVLLGALWGASFLFIRVAAPVLGPLPLMAGRVLIAAAALWLYARARGERVDVRPSWKPLLVLGGVNAAAPFALIAAAEVHLTASTAAVLVAVQPLFASIVGATVLGERVSPGRALGLLLGLAGVAVLVGWSPVRVDPTVLACTAATLLGALCYAVGGIYAKRRLAGLSVLTLALGQQLGAAAWLVVPATLMVPRATVTWGAVGAMVGLALVSTALAYLIFFRLIRDVGPMNTFTVTYVIPVFGVLWGTTFLHERLTLGVLSGLGCILASLALVNGVPVPVARGRTRRRTGGAVAVSQPCGPPAVGRVRDKRP